MSEWVIPKIKTSTKKKCKLTTVEMPQTDQGPSVPLAPLPGLLRANWLWLSVWLGTEWRRWKPLPLPPRTSIGRHSLDLGAGWGVSRCFLCSWWGLPRATGGASGLGRTLNAWWTCSKLIPQYAVEWLIWGIYFLKGKWILCKAHLCLLSITQCMLLSWLKMSW